MDVINITDCSEYLSRPDEDFGEEFLHHLHASYISEAVSSVANEWHVEQTAGNKALQSRRDVLSGHLNPRVCLC